MQIIAGITAHQLNGRTHYQGYIKHLDDTGRILARIKCTQYRPTQHRALYDAERMVKDYASTNA